MMEKLRMNSGTMRYDGAESRLSHMSFQFLSFESDADGLALVTINRPEKRNALNSTVVSELGEAFRIASEDASVKALILTGAGEKAFVAGADIGEIARTDA